MKLTIKQFLQEPLIYFLFIGGLLFLSFEYVGQPYIDDEQTIVVDRNSLLRFMQQKTKAVDQERLIRAFDTLSIEKRKELINAYVREQALYRESKALGLDKDDPIIKNRAIQNLEFITQDYSEAVTRVSDEDLEKYFSENKENYFVEPYVTFTHVFFDSETQGKDIAKNLATEKLQELNSNKVPFSEGMLHGDRFPYHVNYVERTPDFIASHFGSSMADQVFAYPFTSTTQEAQHWQGPLESPYGYHLVLLSRREKGRYPALIDIAGQVYQDAQREQIRARLNKTYKAIIDTYHVELSDDMETNNSEEDTAALAGASD